MKKFETNSLPRLPNSLDRSILRYVLGYTGFSYVYDEIVDYIEKKNLKNETQKIKMIADDLWTARQMVEKGDYGHARYQLAFVTRTLLFIK